jgi:hypothetical protein
MVAGASKADLLADLAGAVDKAVTEGETLQQFRGRFGEIVKRRGWHGWTGEGPKAGEAWRTRVIYETNLSTSYAAGRLAQLKQGDYPLWMYKHADAVAHPRPQHLAWNGLTLPPDHKFWTTHYPPNGWGCKCRVVGVRSASQAKRLGGDPDKEAPRNWDERDAKGNLPGVDEGWDYAPGESVSDTVRTAAQKTMKWDYRLAEAYMKEVPEAQRDALALAIRNQPETGEAVRRYARRVLEQVGASRGGVPPPERPEAAPTFPLADVPPYQTMGLLTSDEAAQIADLTGVEAVGKELYDWTLDRSGLMHVDKQHGDIEAEDDHYQQRPVTSADFSHLPQIIREGKMVGAGRGKKTGMPQVRFDLEKAGEKMTALFEVRRDRRMLALKTFYVGERQTSP